MNNTETMNSTVNYVTELDYTVGGILSATSLLGTVSNITSFIYFTTLKTRNDNAVFFKRLYMIISLNDVLICLGILPFVEATFSENRNSLLFDIELFCTVWFVYWWIVSNLSFVLVAALSVTRLRLLGCPSKRIKPWIAYLVPGVLVTLYILVCAVAFPTHIMYTVYYPDLLQCTFTGRHTQELTTPYSLNTGGDGVVFLVLILLFNSLTTNVFILVTVSFVMSLHRLKKSHDITSLIGGSAKRQREAAKTVVVVTLVYIVFNVPGMLVAMVLTLNILFLNPESFQEITSLSVQYFGDNPLANHYLLPVTGCMCVCLNSAVNPLVYYTRIHGFRGFVKRLLRDVVAIVTPRRIHDHPEEVRENLS